MKRWKFAVLAFSVLWLPACDLTDPFGSHGGNNGNDDDGEHEDLVLAQAEGDQLPGGWSVAEANGGGTPARWRTRVEGDGQDLLWHAVSVSPSDTVNLVLTDAAFTPASLEVGLQVDAVAEDQSAGLVFGATSGIDYHAAIWNGGTGTLTVVRVEAGKSTVLASARAPTDAPADAAADASAWHCITVALGSEHGTVAFDDAVPLTFAAPSDGSGQLGLCTRGTLNASFRHLRVALKRD